MANEVWERLETLVRDVLGFVVGHLSEIPTRVEWEFAIVKDADGSRQFWGDDVSCRDFAGFLSQSEFLIRALPSFGAFSAELERAPGFGDGLPLSSEKRGVAAGFFGAYLVPMCLRALDPVLRGVNLDESAVKVVGELASLSESSVRTMRYVAPLWGVRCEADEVNVCEGVSVRRISDADLAGYADSTRSPASPLDVFQVLTLQFELHAERQEARSSSLPHMQPVRELFDDIVAGLRLAGSGSVGMAFLRAKPASPFVGTHAFGALFPPWKTPGGGEYLLTEERTRAAVEVASRIHALDGDRRFSLALRRFMDAYQKDSPADRLIDYWVALEVLLLPDGGGELWYRAATRLAFFIAEPGDRPSIFALAKKSYQARSGVVHRSQSEIDAELLGATEELLRKALQCCLHRGGVPTDEELNALVLGYGSGSLC